MATEEERLPAVDLDTQTQLVLNEANHLKEKLGLAPIVFLLRRVAWPSYDGFLPRRLLDHESDLPLPALALRGTSDPYLRLSFAESATPSSYFPDDLRGWATKESSDPLRASLVEDIKRNQWPLYDLDELCGIMRAFADFLETGRTHLIATGFPTRRFVYSKWFHSNLSVLYPTRLPLYVLNHASTVSGEEAYSYLWPDVTGEAIPVASRPAFLGTDLTPGPAHWYDGKFRAYAGDGSMVKTVPYKLAPLSHGMAREDAAAVEASRSRVLALYIDILHTLSKAIHARQPLQLRTQCLEQLTRTLSAEECDLYKRVESRYLSGLGFTYHTLTYGLGAGTVLWNILNLMGHVESELQIGRLTKTRTALGDLVSIDGGRNSALASYDELSPEERERVSVAYDAFHGLASDEKEFWADFYHWMIDSYGEFRRSCMGVQVKDRDFPNMHAFLQEMAQLAACTLNLSGRLPGVNVQTRVQPNQPSNYVFQKTGKFWNIIYDGTSLPPLAHSAGLSYLGILLQNANKPFHVRELYYTVNARSRERVQNPYTGMAREELEDEDLHPDSEAKADDRLENTDLLRTYRKGLAELQAELDEARRSGDLGRAKHLSERAEDLQSLISSEFGLNRQPREPGDPNKRAYDCVNRAVNRAYQSIDQVNSDLASHLRSFVQYGRYHYCYSPDRPINWET